MLNNRVRFGNMKRVNRAVWALSVILMMVLGLVLVDARGLLTVRTARRNPHIRKLSPSPRKGVRWPM